MRITSITPMKDEAPFILEWYAYHSLIGVNDFLVFSNDCTDGTDQMLERLDELGKLRHFTNPSVYSNNVHHHWQATKYINTFARLKRSDWVTSFDVDEFICVNVGDGTLHDLFEAVDGANVITFNQLNFGSSGLDAYEDRLLIDQFEYAWAYEGEYHKGISRRGTKSLTHKSAKANYFANHSPKVHEKDLASIKYVNGCGKPLDPSRLLKDVKLLEAPDFGYDLVQLNHYVIKSAESFLVQADRGNANHADRSADFKYWRRYNNNDVHDTRIQRWSERVQDAVADLCKDPELNDLHQRAVEIHQNRLVELKQDENVRALYDRIRKQQRNNPGLTG
ncbi:glycosyltransferase family 2 protein [Octadecabacter ascidiaceicola]|nr:glycosyltransferase family 2 protein [Octadecabacter ascidiaceicola]